MLLTVKDFLLLNLPCFTCNNIPSLSLLLPPSPHFPADFFAVHPVKSQNNPLITFTLKVLYHSSITLSVDPSSNSFSSNRKSELPILLNNSCLLSSCPVCSMMIYSNHLSFDFNKNFILPISLSSQSFLLQDPKKPIQYKIKSDFNKKSTSVTIINSNKSSCLNLPLSPSFKFKNKHQLINKIQNLLNFI